MLAVAVACTSSDNQGQTALTLIDSTLIVESERLYVGKPNAIAVGAEGTVFISDIADRKVIRVDRDGRNLMVVASRGGGPGEVASPTSLALIGDSLLAVKNVGAKRIELFELAPLRYRGGHPILGASTSLSSWKGSLLMGSLEVEGATAYALFDGDSASTPHRGGSLPEIYTRLPLIAQAFGAVEVARDDSTVFGLFEASNTLFRWNIAQAIADSVVLSVTTRRGAQPQVMEELLRDPS